MLYEYTSPWVGFELTSLVVIGTDCIGNYKITIHNHDCWCLQYRYFFIAGAHNLLNQKQSNPVWYHVLETVFLQLTLTGQSVQLLAIKVRVSKGEYSYNLLLTGQSAQLHATKVIVSKGEYSYSLLWLVSLLTSCYKGNCVKGRIFLQLTLTGPSAHLHATKGEYSYSLLWLDNFGVWVG